MVKHLAGNYERYDAIAVGAKELENGVHANVETETLKPITSKDRGLLKRRRMDGSSLITGIIVRTPQIER
jgi:hypothetical protein